VIWEIILRDFWGDILRDLLTRALNLRPFPGIPTVIWKAAARPRYSRRGRRGYRPASALSAL
jgi:hypothetical protein